MLFVGVSSMRDHAGQYKLYFLADEFGRRGIPVTVLVPDIDENRAFFADKPHVATHFYPMGSASEDSRRKSEFVNAGDWSSLWVVGVGLRSFIKRKGKAKEIPLIKDFDEFPSMIGSNGTLRRIYLQWIERRLISQAQGFTCASAFLENAVRKQRPKIGDKLLRLRVAISSAEHVVKPGLVAEMKKQSGDRPVLLYIGSISRFYEDQLEEILKLATTLHQRQANLCLRVVGGGPDLEYYKAKAAAIPGSQLLQFTGQVPREDLASHMEAADVLVFPFAANTFNLSRCPTKAFNYAASNRPLVTNRNGEVAALFGESAFYYPEQDVEALATLCQKALAERGTFNNGIPFRSLTWEARADQFSEWLDAKGWLPRTT
jgi:glycosyltransferase involved in cell wall biosynthesis